MRLCSLRKHCASVVQRLVATTFRVLLILPEKLFNPYQILFSQLLHKFFRRFRKHFDLFQPFRSTQR